jgi:hypothetical protein
MNIHPWIEIILSLQKMFLLLPFDLIVLPEIEIFQFIYFEIKKNQSK